MSVKNMLFIELKSSENNILLMDKNLQQKMKKLKSPLDN
mgnify:CR=1 FL=1